MTIFRVQGMTDRRPKFGQMFRVGPRVGMCILSTPWFVIMI